jgi:Four helix bundle sensory module for signal transduction
VSRLKSLDPMRLFNDLQFPIKISLTFGVGLVVTLVVAIVAANGLQKTNASTNALYTQNTLGVQQALTVGANIDASARDERSAIVFATDAAQRDALVAQSRTEMTAASKALDAYKSAAVSTAQEQQQFADTAAKPGSTDGQAGSNCLDAKAGALLN